MAKINFPSGITVETDSKEELFEIVNFFDKSTKNEAKNVLPKVIKVKKKGKTKSCLNCGRTFYKKGRRCFCSNICSTRYHALKRKVEKVCKYCDKIYNGGPNSIYCSKVCSGKAIQRKRRKIKVEEKCAEVGPFSPVTIRRAATGEETRRGSPEMKMIAKGV